MKPKGSERFQPVASAAVIEMITAGWFITFGPFVNYCLSIQIADHFLLWLPLIDFLVFIQSSGLI